MTVNVQDFIAAKTAGLRAVNDYVLAIRVIGPEIDLFPAELLAELARNIGVEAANEQSTLVGSAPASTQINYGNHAKDAEVAGKRFAELTEYIQRTAEAYNRTPADRKGGAEALNGTTGWPTLYELILTLKMHYRAVTAKETPSFLPEALKPSAGEVLILNLLGSVQQDVQAIKLKLGI